MTTPDLFDEWQTYEKVVANDYMQHRDFFIALKSEISTRLQEPLTIADLGCGDCAPVDGLLRSFEILRYVGIDQSASALRRAQSKLTATGVNFSLCQGSILDELRALAPGYNLIVCSYSLHHLSVDAKQDVLKECRRCLAPGGLLAVIDVFRKDGEASESYTERWVDNARGSYLALDSAEIENVIAHVRSSDLPETVATYRQLAAVAGFAQTNRIAQDANCLNQFVLFS
jgi:ubiquinone/menaquinone biosynthesis C-methylase UbiE